MSIFAWIAVVLISVLGLIAGFIAGIVGVDMSSMIAALTGPLLLLFVFDAIAGGHPTVRPGNSQRSIV